MAALLFSLLSFLDFEGYAQRPNIIYIMSDDMGYGDLSCYGQKSYSTPHIDKLASQGIKLTNCYSAGAVCTPTRAAFMTGRYPARTPVGLMEPLRSMATDTIGLTARYPSLATMMQGAGYETALIGKWHLGYRPQHSPTRNGFDYFFGIHSGGADYISHIGANGIRRHDLYENETEVHRTGYLTELFTDKAVAFLKQEHKKPFLLVLTFTSPHWPWQGPTDSAYPDSVDFREGGSPAKYAAMMKSMDDGVGALMKTLDELRLTEETLVIFTNDNGGERYYSDSGGLAQVKGTLWEGGLRVPAIVRWPDKIKGGGISDQVAITMDWTATILSAGGARAHPNFPLDGVDLMPILRGQKKDVDRTLYWRTFQLNRNTPCRAVRMREWKYLQDQQGEHLFNLAIDQQETSDVKAGHPRILKEMKEKFSAWEQTVLEPIPLVTR